MPPFDIEGAKAAGYNDDEIISHLAETRKFDVEGAKKAGYSSQEILAHLQSAPAAPPAPEEDTGQGRISKSLERGVEGLKSTGYGLAALGADVVGAKDFGTSMLEKYKQTEARAQELASDVPTYKDIHGFGDAGKYAVDAIFENLPMFLPSLVSGGVGAAVARKGAESLVADMVAKKIGEGLGKDAAEKAAAEMVAKRVAVGSAAGAYVPSAGMEMGSIYSDIVDKTGKRGGAGSAAAIVGGSVAGALDVVADVPILGKMFGEAAKDVSGSLIKRLGVEGAKQFLLEGGTEGLQTIVEQASAQAGGSNKAINWDDVVDSALKGGFAGGVLGAGTEAVFGGQQKQSTEEAPSEPLGGSVGNDIADPTTIGFRPVGSAIGIKDDAGVVRIATIDSVKDVNGVPIATFTLHDETDPTLPAGKRSDRVEDLLPNLVDTDVAPLTAPPPEDNAEPPPFDIQSMADQRTAEIRSERKKSKPVEPGTMLDVTGLDNVRALRESAQEHEDEALKITARRNITPENQLYVDNLKAMAASKREEANRLEQTRGYKPIEVTEEEGAAARKAAAPPPMKYVEPKGLLDTEAKTGQGAPQVTVAPLKYEPLTPVGDLPKAVRVKSLYGYLIEQGGINPRLGFVEDVGGAGAFKGLLRGNGISVREAVNRAEKAGYLGPIKEIGPEEAYTKEDIDAFTKALSNAKKTFPNDAPDGGVNPRQAELERRAELKSIFGNAGFKGEDVETIQHREDLHTSFGVPIEETKKLNIYQLKERRKELWEQREAQRVLSESQRLRKEAEEQRAADNALSEKQILERDEADERAAFQALPQEAELPKQERFVKSIEAPEPTEMTAEQQSADADRIFAEISMSSEKKAANDEERSKALEFEKQIEGKTIFEVAKVIAEKSDNPSYRLISSRVLAKLEQLSKAGVEFSFKVLRAGDVVDNRLHNRGLQGAVLPNFLKPNKNFDVYVKSVALSPDNFGTSEKITLHELIHAATLSATRQALTGKIGPNTNIGRLFKDLVDVRSQIIDYVKKKITSKEQLTDFEKEIANAENNFLSKGGTGVDEVITYALTDPRAQSFLESIPYKGSNLFSKFIESIRRFLGLSANSDTALSEVLRISEGFLNADVSEIFPDYKEAKVEQKAKPVQFDLFSELSDPSGAFSISEGQKAKPLLNKDGTEQTAAQVSNTVNKVNRVTGGSPKLASETISRPVLFFAMMQGVARRFPVIANFQSLLQARSERETALIKEGEKPIERMTQLDYKPRKQIEAVMEFARLTNTNITPRNGRITVVLPENYNGVLGRPGEVFMLDKEQSEIFMGIKDYFKARWNQYGQAIGKRWGYEGEWDAGKIQAAIADAQAKGDNRRAKNLEFVNAIYNDAKARENYVPFSRAGDEGFTVRNKLTGEVMYFEMVNTKNVWGGLTGSNVKKNEVIKSKFAELRKKFPELDANGEPLYEVKNRPVVKDDIEKLDVSLIEKLLAATNIADKKDRNSAMNNILEALQGTGLGKTDVKNALRDSLLDQVKKAQRAGFTKESRNVPGYSTNFLQSIIDYNRASASVVSGVEYGQQTEDAYDRTQDGRNVPENIRKYAERVNNYLDSDEKLIGQLKQYGFWSSLWGSASSALVNLSQTPTITATQIAGWAGIPGAGRTMNLSLNMLRALSFDKRKGISLDPNKIKFNSPEEQVAFMDAFNRGRINPTVTQDLHGTSPDNWQEVTKKLGNDASSKLQKFIWNIFDVGTSAFNGAEQVNRATAWLAAYRESQRPGAIAKFKNMYANDERVNLIESQFGLTPANIADFFVNETQFIGGKIDRPEALRGVGGIAFQFKQYPMNYLRILKSNMTSAGPEGKIAGTMMLMALTAFGGLLGLPFADDIVDSYEFIKKNLTGIDPMIEYEMRELLEGMGASPEWAEAAARGPARFLGIDVSKRIGQGQILPDANPIMNIPIFSATIGKIIEANKRFNSDQPVGGIIALASMGLPKGPSDIARGLLQLPMEGYRTQGGDMKVAEPNIGQRVAKAIGFQPTKFSSIQERDYFARRLKYRTKEAEDMLSTNLSSKLSDSISAREKGDSQKADKLMKEFVDRYQRAAVDFGNPSVPLDEKVQPPSINSIKNRALLMMHPELVVKNARKLKRPALYDLYNEQED